MWREHTEKPRFYTDEMLIKPLVALQCQLQQPSNCICMRDQNFPDELFPNSQPTETVRVNKMIVVVFKALQVRDI